MRVMEIVADGSPGGGTTHVLQILRGLSKTCAFGLVTQSDSYLYREAQRIGIPCFGLNFFSSRLDLRIPLRLRRIVADFGPQLIHVHGGRAGFFDALASTGKPTTYTAHGFHFVHKNPLMRWLAVRAERMVIRHAHHTIFVSHHDAHLAKVHGLLPKDSERTVTYPGIALRNIPRACPISATHIGFIGRLEYQKDPLLFLEVIKRLPGYTATIVGGGALGREVKVEIERCGLSAGVRVLGSLSHPQTLQTLTSLSALVMTSRWEGLPIVLLEAMWSGVPVVAIDVGGIAEVIEPGESGLLVNGRSADELARAVVDVTENLTLRKRIIKNARARVSSLFSEESMLSNTQKMYEEILTL
jgi:glycosyltransferase involved in cell wall biosynthesis